MNGTSISNTIQHKPTKLCELCTAEVTECAQTTECARPRNKATDIHMRQQTHKMDCLATRSRVISKGRDGWHCKLCELCTAEAETVGGVGCCSPPPRVQSSFGFIVAKILTCDRAHGLCGVCPSLSV